MVSHRQQHGSVAIDPIKAYCNMEEKKEIIGPKSRKQKMIISTMADTAVVGGAMGCFDAQTEYLSPEGWVSISEYEGGQVAQFNSEEDSIEFVDPSLYIKKSKQSFYQILTEDVDQCITESHSVIYWKDQSDHFYNLPVGTLLDLKEWKGFFKVANPDGSFRLTEVFNKDITLVGNEDQSCYCFTVPSGMLVIRRNGKISITGNSGKSYMALLFPLRYADDPYFRGIIFRKTTGELTAQGGLWETACELYKYVYGKESTGKERIKTHSKDLKITMPNGASLKFSHMEHETNRHQHQGAQYTFVLFDEATHFSKVCVEYLGLRIRSARAKHKKQMVLTCNPDPDWFGLDWIRPYLTESGTPNPSMDGVVRYYVVQNSQYVWSNTREELEDIYGSGADSGIKSFTFISANCLDNPVLLANDPSYVSTLKAKSHVDVQRYLYGNWYIRPENGGFWKREWVPEIPVAPAASEFTKIIRAYDFAGTLPSDANGFRCDYTASVKMGKLKTGDYVILEVNRTHIRFGQWLPFVLENAQKDGKGVDICLPVDPNPAAQGATQDLARKVIEAGYRCSTKRASSAKLDRFRLFAAASEVGLVSIVKGCCSDLWAKSYGDPEFYFFEMEAFDGGRKGHDDTCDATSDAFNFLAQKYHIPSGWAAGVASMSHKNQNPLLKI